MQKTSINPQIFQPFLESAANAGQKGQSQFYTPLDWAKALAQPLPGYRPAVVDLNCGAGNLLQGAVRGSTSHLLGCDIDPCGEGRGPLTIPISRITADVCKLPPLMRAVQFRADCFVLNPPWSLHWYRSTLADLAESDLPTVRAAFAAHDGRLGKDTIDSTIATLALALDRCSRCGEGLLIANNATLQRLLFAPGAPHAALASHVWLHLVIKGNPMTGLDDCSHQHEEQFHTGVIYFARSHSGGPMPAARNIAVNSLAEAQTICAAAQKQRPDLRLGRAIKSYEYSTDTTEQWQAIGEEWARLHPSTPNHRPLWNLTLRPDGSIETNLSLFDTKSSRVTKAEAEALFSLNGCQPMRLVTQREQRARLQRAAFGTTWRVDPKLQEAVQHAINEYNRVRAPLYPLSPIQRLGFLDEADEIVCVKDLLDDDGGDDVRSPRFKADRHYALRSTTVAVKRSGQKRNLAGELDDVEWDGCELAFFIKDETGVERIFMEGRLRDESVRLSLLKAGEKPGRQDEHDLEVCVIDHTLNQLIEHFTIPDVPDVATVNPQGYQQNIKLLEEIENLTAVAVSR